MEQFIDNDEGYLKWVNTHPNGFVINSDRKTRYYFMLHRATCGTIRTAKRENWTKDYIKICLLDRDELEKWVQDKSHKPKLCQICNP